MPRREALFYPELSPLLHLGLGQGGSREPQTSANELGEQLAGRGVGGVPGLMEKSWPGTQPATHSCLQPASHLPAADQAAKAGLAGGLPSRRLLPSEGRRVGRRATGVPAPLPGRLRTAEQEAIWGGMGAVRRRRQPQRTRSAAASLPAPPAGLIAESGLIGNANGN